MKAPILAGWVAVGRGSSRHFTKNGARVIPSPFGAHAVSSKAWIAIAPGISASGPTPEAAVIKLRDRALKATE